MADSHREAFGGQRRRGRAAGRECHGEEDGGTVAENHREAATAGKESHCWKGKILLERRATAGKERYCWKGEILLEMRATAGKEMRTTAGKERKGVRLPARRDCREQRVGLFF